jgi:hypothetical protein
MRKPIIGAALLGLLAPPSTALAQSDYPENWQEGFHPGISRALAKHQIRGCAHLRYKENTKQSGVFRVECSKDGKAWQAYRVDVSSRAVEGPLDQ